MRIVSMLSSATEIVCALGAESMLVGRSHECDYPPSILGLPICTESRIDVSASSAEIDAQVKDSLRNALSIYQVRADALDRLQPNLIITQAQCEVCAVSIKDVEDALCQMIGSRPRIVSLNPNSLADVWADIRHVAEALEIPEKGRALVEELQGRMREVSARANNWGRKPTVACIEWIDPLMAAGNWMPELVELAGGITLFGEAGKHSPWMSFDDLYREDPDVIVVMPCGFDLPRTREEMPALTSQSGWERLKAVRNGRVHVCDGNAYFNRPGPRLVEALEMLAEAIQPAAFCFGHEGMEVY
jgi:iron complex transport system substrate-binding protein